MITDIFFDDVSALIEENATATPTRWTLGITDDPGLFAVGYDVTDPTSPFQAVRYSTITNNAADFDVWVLIVRPGGTIDFEALDPASQNIDGQRIIQVEVTAQDNAESTFTQTLNVYVSNVSGLIDGTPGNDRPLNGTTEEDAINGLAGNDLIVGAAGDDIIDGGDGFDAVSYAAATAPVTVDLATGTASAGDDGNDTLTNIEAVSGSDLSGDMLYGDANVNLLSGGAGADVMRGRAGSDIYVVDDQGDDIFEDANAGTDTVYSYLNSYLLPSDFEQLVLVGNAQQGTGNELDNVLNGIYSSQNLVLRGGDGNDVLYGSNQTDTLFGGNGADFLIGGNGADQLFGGDGSDVYIVTAQSNTITELQDQGLDTVYSSIPTFTLNDNVEQLVVVGGGGGGTGNGSDNILNALYATGAVHLYGAGGNDVLYGSNFGSTLEGGQGNDALIGGTVADIFQYATTNTGTDVIYGFQDGIDQISFAGRAAVTGMSDLAIYNIDNYGSLIVVGGDLIWVGGVAAVNLTAADFQLSLPLSL